MFRGDWFRMNLDRASFLGVFLIGVVIIILAGSGRAEAPVGLPWAVLVMLIVLMVAYACLSHYRKVRHWGDMCYYMGFLFTLVSMMAALRQYTAGTSLDEIIPTFALALGTTVTGLVLRVVGDEQPTEEQHDELPFFEPAIRDGAERVAKALDGLANEIEWFQRDLRSGGPDLLAGLQNSLVEPVASQAEGLARALDKVSERTDHVGTVFDRVSGDIDTRWRETWAQLETPAARLVAFGRDMAGLTAGFRELAAAQSSVLASLESVRDTSAGVLEQSQNVLTMQRQAVDKLRSVVESVLGATTKAHHDLIATGDQIGARTSELQRALGSWESAIDSMTIAGENQATLVGDIHNSVAELVRTVAGIPAAVDSIADGAAEVHQAGTLLRAASNQMERLSDELAKFPQRVNEAHREGAERLGRELDRSLANVTTSIRQAIRDAVDQASGPLHSRKRGGLLARLFLRRDR